MGYEIIPPGDNESIELNGDHGYDSRSESMHAIFYGFGPAFLKNPLAVPFETVDIYPLMSRILKIKGRETNGSFDRVKHILHENFYMDFFHEVDSLVEHTTKDLSHWGWLGKSI